MKRPTARAAGRFLLDVWKNMLDCDKNEKSFYIFVGVTFNQ